MYTFVNMCTFIIIFNYYYHHYIITIFVIIIIIINNNIVGVHGVGYFNGKPTTKRCLLGVVSH